MHDIRAIRDNPDGFEAALQRRGLSGVTEAILALDGERRAKIAEAETAQAETPQGETAQGETAQASTSARSEAVQASPSDTARPSP